MKIGITGTREGANESQLAEVRKVLEGLKATAQEDRVKIEFHHGDCLGVDEQMALIASELGYHVVCHPPKSDHLRAFHSSNEFKQPLGYMQRDRNIVDACDILFVVPLQNKWQNQGGTWYTHDYAKRTKKPLHVFWPGETV